MKYLLLFFISLFYLQSSKSQEIENVNYPINSPNSSEYAPAISPDGRRMIFCSNKNGNWQLYETIISSNGNWSVPKEIVLFKKLNNQKIDIKTACFNHDANRIYFSSNYKKGFGGFDIYYSNFENNKWQKPTNLGNKINTQEDENSPSISSNNCSLFFTRKSKLKEIDEDKDCQKIFLAKKDELQNWKKATALPFPINSGCEKSPYICLDNKTLIYSSIKKDSKTDFDLYYTKSITDKIWEVPEKIDSISTKFNDEYPCLTAWTKDIYFNITKKKERIILKKKLPYSFKESPKIEISGYINSLETQRPIMAKIKIFDAYNNEFLGEFQNNKQNGIYSLFIEKTRNYKIIFSKKNYSQKTLILDFDTITTTNKININANLFSEVRLDLNIFDAELLFAVSPEIFVKNPKTNENFDVRIIEKKTGIYYISLPIGEEYIIQIKKQNYIKENFHLNLKKEILSNKINKNIILKPEKISTKINILDAKTQKNLAAEIIIKNLNKKEKIRSYISEKQTFEVFLRRNNNYILEVENLKGYAFFSKKIKSSSINKELKLKLSPLKIGVKFIIKNIEFEKYSSDLNGKSINTLNNIIEFLNTNKNIRIEISAHTNSIGADLFNEKLSQNRAEVIMKFLIANNINKNRLIAKGYGERMPIVPNNTDEGLKKNQRIEFKIID